MNAAAAGFGLGLRAEHYQDFIEQRPRVDWLEIISENFMVPGGRPLANLDRIRRDYPMVMHGVSLSIGSVDPLNLNYLSDLKALAERIEPVGISDHLCFTGVDHSNLHDLLPIPYTQASLTHIAERVSRVQDFLGRRLALENVSSYVSYKVDAIAEWDFLAELARRTGCSILLDVNNVYVSSVNHGFNPEQFIDAIPTDYVSHIHLAGHEDHGDYIIDTHDHPICEGVWDLYRYTRNRMGPVPTMIERDDNIPPLAERLVELNRARQIAVEPSAENWATRRIA
jgi:uncharacterized protein (UPF0276 family)